MSRKWILEKPELLAKAMVLAEGMLFVAGPPGVVDEEDIWGRTLEPEVQAKLHAQIAALEGSQGGLLWAISTADGGKLAEYKLESVPTFDGMVAADGRLYLSMKNGCILCMAGR